MITCNNPGSIAEWVKPLTHVFKNNFPSAAQYLETDNVNLVSSVQRRLEFNSVYCLKEDNNESQLLPLWIRKK